jgi:hypothetical protein
LAEYGSKVIVIVDQSKMNVKRMSSEIQCSAEAVVMDSREASEYPRLELKQGSIGAFQFLLDKVLEYARAGAEAERTGDTFAQVKYQRALAMLRPIAYFRGSDDFITSVRQLFVQISKRVEVVLEKRTRETPQPPARDPTLLSETRTRHSLGPRMSRSDLLFGPRDT